MQSDQAEKTEAKPLKACCACKPTRKMRDECLMNFGPEKCEEFVNAHNDCLRQLGFKVVAEEKPTN